MRTDDENQMNSKMRKLARVLFALMQAVALLLIVADFVRMSGTIEQRLIPALSARVAGLRIHVSIEGWRPLQLRALRVYDATAPAELAPLVRADSVVLDIQPQRPAPGRRLFSSLRIYGLALALDGRQADSTNYAFLSAREAGDGTGRDMRFWLPEQVSLQGCSLRIEQAEWMFTMAGLNGEVTLDSLDRLRAIVQGNAVQTGWYAGAIHPAPLYQKGRVAAALTRDGANMELDAQVLIPDFLELDGKITGRLTASPALSMDISTLRSKSPVLGELLSTVLPMPLRFDSVDVEPLRLDAAMENKRPILSDATVNAVITGVVIGAPDAPWYSGDCAVEATGTHDVVSHVVMKTTLNKQQVLTGEMTIDEGVARMHIALAKWRREQVAALWPQPWEAWSRYLPAMEQATAETSLVYDGDTTTFDGKLLLGGTAVGAPSTSFSGHYSISHGLDAQATLLLGNGRAELAAVHGMEAGTSAALTLTDISLADLVQVVRPDLPHEKIRASVNGAITLEQDDGGGYRYTGRVTSESPEYDTWSVGPISMEANGAAPSDFSALTASAISLSIAEDTTLHLTNVHSDLNSLQTRANIAGAADLATVGGWLGMDDLWGNATVQGALHLDGFMQGTVSPGVLVFESVGYDYHSLPYGSTLTIEMPVAFDIGNTTLRGGPLLATLDDDTRLKVETMAFSLTEGASATGLVFETGFAPMVAKNYLDNASGNVTLSSEQLRYVDGSVAGSISYQCEMDRLVLPNALADLRGVSAQGSLVLGPTPDGDGVWTISELLAAGVTVQGAHGAIRFADNTLVLDDIGFDLFGGGVTGKAELSPFTPDMLLVIRGVARNLDLSIFTSEFEPASLILTGRVNGTFAAGIGVSQLNMLEIDLEAQDGFSMNRDMVEQLLMNQYMDDISGGRRMSRMLQSVIGTEPQRPFDHAMLKLGLEEERITGDARLESEALNLTVDIKADPPALLEAMRIRQQQQVD